MHKLFTDLPVSIVINTWSRKLLTLPEHLRSPSVFSWVRVARSLVFRVMLCRSLCLSFCLCSFLPPLCCVSFFDVRLLITYLVSFGHCVVCPSSMYGFWLPLWYLQTFLMVTGSAISSLVNSICNNLQLQYSYLLFFLPSRNHKSHRDPREPCHINDWQFLGQCESSINYFMDKSNYDSTNVKKVSTRSIWAVKLYWLDTFLLYTVSHGNSLSGTWFM